MNHPQMQDQETQQRVAIEGKDTDIYPYLSICHQARFEAHLKRKGRADLCPTITIHQGYETPAQGNYEQRPETLPFDLNDLQDFLRCGPEQFEQGYWSVYWASEAKPSGHDIVYDDGYRSVVSFRTIEFMIRPTADYKNRSDGIKEPTRLNIGGLDVRTCLMQALHLQSMRSGPMRTFTGRAQTRHSGKDKRKDEILGEVEVNFDWRIDRALEAKMEAQVKQWRFNAFGGAPAYRAKLAEIYQAEHGHKGRKSGRGKRRSGEMSASQELSPSSKRRSFGSQPSGSSQSPEMGRRAAPTTTTTWSQPARRPPPNPYSAPQGPAPGYSGYNPSQMAPPPPLGQPQGSRRGHHVAGFAQAQSGSAYTGYLGNTAPAPGTYVPDTGNYPPSAYGAATPTSMPPFPGTAGGSWGGGAYAASPPVASAAMATPGGTSVFDFLDPSSSSAPGGSYDASQHQDTSAGSAPGWWNEAGQYMSSGQPYGGNQPGYPGQYGGGSGSGQR